ncbi:DUF4031 domain-containing protein [Streptomyces xiamenensis]|uniref:DUF4031 domain-containing protein n=1 Tax=Streptomyces xiamenensis TaxID=408015 RepID=UPI0035D72AEC
MLYVDLLVDYGQDVLDRGMPSSRLANLTADTESELHEAARNLDIPLDRFQSQGDGDHRWRYAVTPTERDQAIWVLGAKEVDRDGMMKLIAARRRTPSRAAAPRPAAQAAIALDWGDRSHFDHSGDKPCVLCPKLTPLRSHRGEAVHKTCAETWLSQHPGDTRFVSDGTA